MPTFNSGDIVRVARQPYNYPVCVVGYIGFIENITPTQAQFTYIGSDGAILGGGSIPLDCLEHETEPTWKQAKALYDENIRKGVSDSLARGERIAARMSELSAEYGLPVEQIKALIADVEWLRKNDWQPK